VPDSLLRKISFHRQCREDILIYSKTELEALPS